MTDDALSELRRRVVEASGCLKGGSSHAARAGRDQGSASGAVTSDLTIDETLLLHAVGWSPVELVTGVAFNAVPVGVWYWGSGEIEAASYAYSRALQTARDRIARECAEVGGQGVVGVHVEVTVHQHYMEAVLLGTAVRGPGRHKDSAFVSDLSARDFALLTTAGWLPVGLAFGASFVYAPRRTAGMAMAQAGQNVELTNLTEALYSAREAGMERMQADALRLGGQGVVQVKITEGPVSFANHAMGFAAWGTVVRAGPEGHQPVEPQLVVSLDDAVVEFAAESMRGAGPG